MAGTLVALKEGRWHVELDETGGKLMMERHLRKLAPGLGGERREAGVSTWGKARGRRQQRVPKYSIVGSWDGWETHQMSWEASESSYHFSVVLGGTGWESFKILLDGDWMQCVYPDVPDATWHEEHLICGPDYGDVDQRWTIGKHAKDAGGEGAARVQQPSRLEEVGGRTFRAAFPASLDKPLLSLYGTGSASMSVSQRVPRRSVLKGPPRGSHTEALAAILSSMT